MLLQARSRLLSLRCYGAFLLTAVLFLSDLKHVLLPSERVMGFEGVWVNRNSFWLGMGFAYCRDIADREQGDVM
jgi:hypothetical protein